MVAGGKADTLRRVFIAGRTGLAAGGTLDIREVKEPAAEEDGKSAGYLKHPERMGRASKPVGMSHAGPDILEWRT